MSIPFNTDVLILTSGTLTTSGNFLVLNNQILGVEVNNQFFSYPIIQGLNGTQVIGSGNTIFISGVQTGQFVTQSQTGNFLTASTVGGVYSLNGLSGALQISGINGEQVITSGGYLLVSGLVSQAQINSFVTTGQTGIFITNGQTGQFLTSGSAASLFYPLNSNPSGYIIPSQTGQFASSGALSNSGQYILSLITASSAGVSALNGASGLLNIVGSGGTTVGVQGQNIIIASYAPSGAFAAPIFRSNLANSNWTLSPTNTFTTIPFDSPVVDNFTGYNTGTYKYTCQLSGYYNLHANVTLSNSTSNANMVVAILVNSTPVVESTEVQLSTDIVTINASSYYFLNSGDTVSAQLSQTNATSTVYSSTNPGYNTFLEGVYLPQTITQLTSNITTNNTIFQSGNITINSGVTGVGYNIRQVASIKTGLGFSSSTVCPSYTLYPLTGTLASPVNSGSLVKVTINGTVGGGNGCLSIFRDSVNLLSGSGFNGNTQYTNGDIQGIWFDTENGYISYPFSLSIIDQNPGTNPSYYLGMAIWSNNGATNVGHRGDNYVTNTFTEIILEELSPGVSTYISVNNTNNSTNITSLSGNYIDTTLPVGCIIDYGGNVVPSGWLLCNGSAVSRTNYYNLFSTIGTTYGVGDGSGTFNLPNCGLYLGNNPGYSGYSNLITGGASTGIVYYGTQKIIKYTPYTYTGSSNTSVFIGSYPLSSGINIQNIPFGATFLNAPVVIASVQGPSGSTISSQVLSITTTGFTFLTPNLPASGYSVSYFVATGTGLYQYGGGFIGGVYGPNAKTNYRSYTWYNQVIMIETASGPIYQIETNQFITGVYTNCKQAVEYTVPLDIQLSNNLTGPWHSIFSSVPTLYSGSQQAVSGLLSTIQLTQGQYMRYNINGYSSLAQGLTTQLITTY